MAQRPVPTRMDDEGIRRVEEDLLAALKPGYLKNIGQAEDDVILDFIRKTLKDNNAILSGGFVLRSYLKYIDEFVDEPLKIHRSDLDFYVPCKNLINFNKTMLKLSDLTRMMENTPSLYCASFLRRNRIRTVQRFYNVQGNRRPRESVAQYDMDIMAVRNARSPLDVVQNFDLTFCQIWYDGEAVYATHPDHITNRSGELQNDYVDIYMTGNSFLHTRVRKYIERGFTIKIPSETRLKDFLTVKKCRLTERDENFFKSWISRTFLHTLVKNTYGVSYQPYSFGNKLMNIAFKEDWPGGGKNIDNEEFTKPIDEMKNLQVMDGYDSEDYDIDRPEVYYPLLDKMKPFIPRIKRDEWLALDNETKYWKCLNILRKNFYSTFDSPFNLRGSTEKDRIEDVFFYMNHLKRDNNTEDTLSKCIDKLKECTQRIGTDAITLDDGPVCDLHSHTMDDAISSISLETYLEGFMERDNKKKLPCFVRECTWDLTIDEIRSIVSEEFYERFTYTPPPPLPPPDTLLGTIGMGNSPDPEGESTLELVEILRDVKTVTDGWGEIYHHVMCPFCLAYISREKGCVYVYHPDATGNMTYDDMPKCKVHNIVNEVRSKYKQNNISLEVCAECGRPCSDHKHFDLEDPTKFAPMPMKVDIHGEQIPDYSKCPGGGRREAIARIIGVKRAMEQNPDLDPVELRRVAAIAAEDAAKDNEILAKADEILAKAPADRMATDIDSVPAAQGAPEEANNNAPEEANNNAPEEANNNAPEEANNNASEEANNNAPEEANNNNAPEEENNAPAQQGGRRRLNVRKTKKRLVRKGNYTR
jgi:hypothetical protein